MLNTVVIGAGRLGGFHANKMAAHPDVDLRAIIDPSSEARERVAEATKTDQTYADFSEVSEKIDAAVIASPTAYHHEIACDLLNRGIHVLVEKPICTTVEQADELVELAAAKGLVLQVGHIERFNPAFRSVAGYVTDAKFIESLRCGPFSFRSTDVGVVLDLMIHDIDLVLSLVHSPVRSVSALGVSVLGGNEDVANARLEFENGCIATLSTSRVSYEAARKMQIWSSGGFASVDFNSRRRTLVKPSETLLRRQYDATTVTADQIAEHQKLLAEKLLPRQEEEFEAADPLQLEANDFVAAIEEGRPPLVTGKAGRDALEVAHRVLRSIEHHAWDDRRDGLVGPMLQPRDQILSMPRTEPTEIIDLTFTKKAG